MFLNLLKSMVRNSGSPRRTAPRGEPFIAFITPVDSPHFLAAGERLAADQASMRLRVGIPARELARTRRVCLVPIDYVERDPTLAALGSVQAVAVGKLPVSFFLQQRARTEALLGWIETMARRKRVVVDFSDDLAAAAQMYAQPVLAEIQRRLLALCPATVPTRALQERLAGDARHGITVIEDPYEAARAGEPRFAPGPVVRLAWFGVFGPPLRAMIESEFTRIARRLAPRAVELAFVTHASQAALVQEIAAGLRKLHEDFAMRPVAWSLDAVARELHEADAVLLPQDTDSRWGSVKSHNRLVETLRAGRLGLASPIPAYRELEPYAWIGADLAEGLEWALNHPDEVVQRIASGQRHIEERFAPARIAERWAGVLES